MKIINLKMVNVKALVTYKYFILNITLLAKNAHLQVCQVGDKMKSFEPYFWNPQ